MIHDDPRLRDRAPVFADRMEAGRALARLLAAQRAGGALVLAIPCGGVPVALELARSLALELDVAPVSKVLLPWTTEAGFGAVAFDGSVWVNEDDVLHYGLEKAAIEEAVSAARTKVARRLKILRGDRPLPELAGRAVILVDDGIAAGSTMRAAIAALRRLQATKVIVAVPTAHRRAAELVAGLADEVYCANLRGATRFAVADAYEEWRDVSDAEAEALLGAPTKGKP